MDIIQEQYEVVKNSEEQYSIWPQEKEVPSGWSKVGCSGEKEVCLSYIENVWVDMRPLSLRKHIESLNLKSEQNKEELQTATKSLIDLLLNKKSHQILIPFQPTNKTDFLDQISSKICYIEFNEIVGQPQLALSINTGTYELNENYILFKGSLTLDLVPIECHCKIDSKSFKGTCGVKKYEYN